MQPKYVVIMLIVLAFVLSTVGVMAQSPNRDTLRVGGCVPGETYDPACDVDHDGDVDIFDIQLAAGHWNQAGTYTSGSWDLTGNAGTNPTTNFLGTTDAVTLTLAVSNTAVVRIVPVVDNFGIYSPNIIWGHERNAVGPDAIGATIGGGGYQNNANEVTGRFGTVAGGSDNTAAAFSFVGGGGTNTASGGLATIGGGSHNTASDGWDTIGGGSENFTNEEASTVGGGVGNSAIHLYSTVSGGSANLAAGYASTVGGGQGNVASAERATIAGGFTNEAVGGFSTVGGGYDNSTLAGYSTIGGGLNNVANGDFSLIGGGIQNNASGNATAVAGGAGNTASGNSATVGGGGSNTTGGNFATVSGGHGNMASGISATVPGGQFNSATGQSSFAAGQRAKANHDGALVWADNTDADFTSTGANQFLIRATGGVGIGTDEPQSALQVVGNYIQFPTITGAPPLTDCDEAIEAGRMVVRIDGPPDLYICRGTTGWARK